MKTNYPRKVVVIAKCSDCPCLMQCERMVLCGGIPKGCPLDDEGMWKRETSGDKTGSECNQDVYDKMLVYRMKVIEETEREARSYLDTLVIWDAEVMADIARRKEVAELDAIAGKLLQIAKDRRALEQRLAKHFEVTLQDVMIICDTIKSRLKPAERPAEASGTMEFNTYEILRYGGKT